MVTEKFQTSELDQIKLLTIQEVTQSLRSAYDLGWDRDIVNHLHEFAGLRAKQKSLEEGVELLSLLLQQPASHLVHAGGDSIGDRAKSLLANLENQLSEEAYRAALKRGESLDIDGVVVELLAKKITFLK